MKENKIKRLYLTSFAFAFVASLFLSCRKDKVFEPGQLINFPEGDIDTFLIEDEYIKSLIFQPGTFWVYQNDSTGEKDSIIVENTFHDYFSRTYPGANEKWEIVQMTIFNPSKSQRYYMYVVYWIISNSLNNTIPGNTAMPIVGQPIYSTMSLGSESFGMGINSKQDSILIYNYWYKDITETKITASNQKEMFYSNDTYLYFAKDFGIIKRQMGNESWSLKNWNIVK